MRGSASNRAVASDLRPKLTALLVASCFAGEWGQAFANPTGPSVVAGSATFSSAGNLFSITNSSNAIINWQSFSIGTNEITKFIQPSALSAVLNRVTGAGGTIPQSVIDGILSSNGRVFLLNPTGVVFGAGARLDVAGLVTSSLSLSNEDFLAGRLRFAEVPGAGGVINQGVIETVASGRVYLIAPKVENSGVIRTPQGEIVLAAGKSVELVSERSPYVTARIKADTNEARNLGSLIADAGRIGIHGALVTQSGVAEATGASVGPGGEIRFVASQDLTLTAGSRASASGTSGGKVVLQAENGTTLIAGTAEAAGATGRGGAVQALGVRVGVIGKGVIDASGETGGGTVLVGGDFQGKNPDVQNAQQTVIGKDGVIRADARTTGDGGKIVVWADKDTRFYGTISARGGSASGNGGNAEVSSKETLAFRGKVDTRAPNGKMGTLLLDPDTIVIEGGEPGYGGGVIVDGEVLFDTPPSTTTIYESEIEQQSAGADITLQANRSITVGGQPFNYFSANSGDTAYGTLALAQGSSLTLQTRNNGIGETGSIDLVTGGADGANLKIVASGAGSITVHSGVGGNQPTPIKLPELYSGSGGVDVRALYGGNIDIKSITTAQSGQPAGNVVVQSDGPGTVSIPGLIDTRGPNFSSANNYYGGGTVTIAGSTVSLGTAGLDAINTSGGAQSPDGGPGGDAGSITITGNSISVAGSIMAYGGAGGWGTSAGPSNGQPGGAGGTVTLNLLSGESSLTIGGLVNLDGGPGGNGGDTNAPGTPGGWGGNGGNAGTLNAILAGSESLLELAGGFRAKGGDGGAGGVGGGNGGSGGSGGSLNISPGGSSNAIQLANVTLTGGNGGAGGSGSADFEHGGQGGQGGNGGTISNIYYGGNFALPETIDLSGGRGGDGGSTAIASGTGGNAGDGGEGGTLSFSANAPGNDFVISPANWISRGGDGGAGGSSNDSSGGTGGRGGNGGEITGTVMGGLQSLTISGSIDLNAGNGGNGGAGGSGGNGGSGGIGGGIVVHAEYAAIAGNVTLSGSISAQGGEGGTGGFGSNGGGSGGNGGNGGIAWLYFDDGQVADVVLSGSLNLKGGRGGNGGFSSNATGGTGGDGGEGGYVYFGLGNADVNSIAVSADLSGGRGGDGGEGSTFGGDGGRGGTGGLLAFNSSYSTVPDNLTISGSVSLLGGEGGTGGNASGSKAGSGGAGGEGGRVDFQFSGAEFDNLTFSGQVDLSGSAGGNGGNGTGSAAGGDGGSGGYGGRFEFTAYGGGVIPGDDILFDGSITARGGSGGNGGNGSSTGNGGTGGTGGDGGLINLDLRYVNVGDVSIALSGLMDLSGGRGGDGGSASSGNGGAGGNGGSGGRLDVQLYGAALGDVTISGSVTALGGDGGKGGDSTSGAGGQGGSGGHGGRISVSNYDYGYSYYYYNNTVGSVTISGSTDLSGGNGGNGGAGSFAGGAGGDGGEGGYLGIEARYASILGNVSIQAPVTARGGNGGAGGLAADGQGGNGGSGGAGGSISLYLESSSIANVTVTGGLALSGGIGGDGGADETNSVGGGAGGSGGSGGQVSVDLYYASFQTVTVTGSIDALGGNGGNGGLGAAGFGGNGGGGGSGGAFDLDLRNSSGGTVAIASTLNLNGGSGGNGASGNGADNNGGMGGSGGFGGGLSAKYDAGSFDSFTISGSVSMRGGPGGNGGNSADSSGGQGGAGGHGGFKYFAGPAQTATITASFDVSGGNGGNGGNALGLTSGSGGHGGAGGSASDFSIYAAAPGALIANGGNGGNGGASPNAGGDGGEGGQAGMITINGVSVLNAVSSVGGSGGAGGINLPGGEAPTPGALGYGASGRTVTVNAPGSLTLQGNDLVAAGSGNDGAGGLAQPLNGQLIMYGGGDIFQAATSTLQVDNLLIQTTGPTVNVELMTPSNNIMSVFAREAYGGPVPGNFSLTTNDIRIGVAPHADVTATGNILLQDLFAGGTLEITRAESSGGSVGLVADILGLDSLASPISSPLSVGWSTVSQPLVVDQSFFDPARISAPGVKLGSSTQVPSVVLSGPIDLASLNITTLALASTGDTYQSGGPLTVTNLAAQGANVLFPEANQVVNLQAQSTSPTGQVTFTNAGPLTLGVIDSSLPPGVSALGGVNLDVNGDLIHGTGASYSVQGATATLSANGMIGGPTDPMRVKTLGLVTSSAGSAYLDVNASDPAAANLQVDVAAGDAQITGAGAFNLTSGNAGLFAGVSATGAVSISTTGSITHGAAAGEYSVQGASVSLFAPLVGSPAAPLQVGTDSLLVSAADGAYLATNQFDPASLNAQVVVDHGDAVLANAGPLNLALLASALPNGVSASGTAAVLSTSTITQGPGTNYGVQGGSAVLLSSSGDLGSTSTPLRVRTAQLEAVSGGSAYVNLNATDPAAAQLQASVTGGEAVFTGAGGLQLSSLDASLAPGASASGNLSLTTTSGNITQDPVAAYFASGSEVRLDSAGSIGAPATPLLVRTPSLFAAAATGIDITTNQFGPMPVTVGQLVNSTSGGLTLNAYGGATTTSLAKNGGGNVTLATHSPLSVLAGISSAGNINLLTSGTGSNDIALDGIFTYATGGNFVVNLGIGGGLVLATSFNGVITQKLTNDLAATEFFQSLVTTDTSAAQTVSSVNEAIATVTQKVIASAAPTENAAGSIQAATESKADQSGQSLGEEPSSDDDDKKQKERQKSFGACKP